ncbi:hypothetical protein [Shewanella sp. 10N.286.52.A9]|uniref:hypothetical protein n=1 Tax=Shewanella sp. 10N.286.52.A9 TaxID=3229711 RepID=UPI00354DF701
MQSISLFIGAPFNDDEGFYGVTKKGDKVTINISTHNIIILALMATALSLFGRLLLQQQPPKGFHELRLDEPKTGVLQSYKPVATANNRLLAQAERASEQASTNQQTSNFIARLEQANQIASFEQRAPIIKNLLQQWSNHDIHAVLHWLQQQPITNELGEYYSPVLQRYMQEDELGAGEMILSLPAFDVMPSIIAHYINHLTHKDVEAALLWVDSIHDDLSKQQATQSLLNAWSQQAPLEVMQYLSDNSQISENVSQNAMISIANQLSKQQHQASIDAIHQYPEVLQTKLVYSLLTHWPISDAANAIEWINTLDGGLKNEAIRSYIDYFGVSQQPEVSFELATNMVNHPLKSALLLRVLTHWYRIDPSYASQRVRTTMKLTELEKQQLIAQVNQAIERSNHQPTR